MKKLHIIKEFVNGPILSSKGFPALAARLNESILALGGIRANGTCDYDNVFSRFYNFRDEDAPIAKEILEKDDWSIDCIEAEGSAYIAVKNDFEALKQKHINEQANLIFKFCIDRAVENGYDHWMLWGSRIKRIDGNWVGKYFAGFSNGKNNYIDFKLNNVIWERI